MVQLVVFQRLYLRPSIFIFQVYWKCWRACRSLEWLLMLILSTTTFFPFSPPLMQPSRPSRCVRVCEREREKSWSFCYHPYNWLLLFRTLVFLWSPRALCLQWFGRWPSLTWLSCTTAVSERAQNNWTSVNTRAHTHKTHTHPTFVHLLLSAHQAFCVNMLRASTRVASAWSSRRRQRKVLHNGWFLFCLSFISV